VAGLQFLDTPLALRSPFLLAFGSSGSRASLIM
jgi:hypothetical protein